MITFLPGLAGIVSVGELLSYQASIRGDKEAVVCGNERLNYNQLLQRTRAVSYHLHTLGVCPGDTVAVCVPNSIDYIAAFCGASSSGAVVVPINPQLKPEEIRHIFADLHPKALIVHSETASALFQILVHSDSFRGVLLIKGDNDQPLSAVPEKVKIVELNRHHAPSHFDPVALDTDRLPAAILYTSGTTGKPKGVVLSHANFLASIGARLDRCGANEHDRFLCMLPMAFGYTLTATILTSILLGATLVVLPKFDAKRALELIGSERITVIPGNPAVFQRLLSELGLSNSFDLSSVRVCWSASAPMPISVLEATEKRFGAPVLVFFGMTELCGSVITNSVNAVRKLGSIGTPAPNFQAEALDADGNILPPGSTNVGELAIKGPSVMLGYHGQPETTSQAFKNGWFLTGDLVYKDEDGYIFLVGRKKDVINRGGAKIYPLEVESVIMKLAGVTEVAVLGVPCEYMGERVKAVVATLDPGITEEAVKQQCQDNLADYKVPRIVVLVDSLPRNSTGKVDKKLLR